MHFLQTSPGYFAEITEDLRQCSPIHAENVDPVDIHAEARFYLSDDQTAGFAITTDGELKYVWSTLPGQGDAIVSTAVEAGAEHLNCFDGHLVTLYSRHGFVVDSRTPNWTEGEPDVVTMSHTNRYN